MTGDAAAAGTDIVFERRGRLGLITHPLAACAEHADLDSGGLALDALAGWVATDPGIATEEIAIRGEGTRAFCAGGDIRALYDLGIAGRTDEALQFWREEYPLNTRIKEYPKPYVALIRGFVMGGGVGVSIHGSHRVALGEIGFAMPEVGIGFFPDVGATYLLPRLPAGVGLWLALTGKQIGAADALALGIITHHVAAERGDAIIAGLAAGATPEAAIAPFRAAPSHAAVDEMRPAIGRLFAGDSVEAVLAALDAEAEDGLAANFATDTAGAIRQKSPTSLKIAFEQLKRGPSLDFRAAMRTEFQIAARVVRGRDLYEGIRAVVVDKDNAPRWQPASLAEVSAADTAAYFAPLAASERAVVWGGLVRWR